MENNAKKQAIKTKIAVIKNALKENQKKEKTFEKKLNLLKNKRNDFYLAEKQILLQELKDLEYELQVINQDKNMEEKTVENLTGNYDKNQTENNQINFAKVF